MLSIDKSSLSPSHPSFDFSNIKDTVQEQQQQMKIFAKGYFNRQILLSDTEAFRIVGAETPLMVQGNYTIEPSILPLGTPTSFLNDPKGFSFLATPAQPSDVIDRGLFSIDGSTTIGISEFEKTCPAFFHKSRRVTEFRGRVHLRGGRYTISANPTFELRQKLKTYLEDFNEGLLALGEKNEYIYRIGIADYVKNAVLTMFNSFLYQEKIGHYYLDRTAYQSLRRDAQKLAQASVELFYGTMGRLKTMTEQSLDYLSKHKETFKKLQAYILEEYKRGVFSSRHMTRPEASHPLVIAGAALRTAMLNSAPNRIIGLPAGSTEFALLQSAAFRLLKKANVPVLLVPVSLHSIKHDFDGGKHTEAISVRRFLREGKANLKGEQVLIVDDNSSTGQTIQLVADALRSIGAHLIDQPSIAEADIIRSELDRNNPNRDRIADRMCYYLSVSILPVSRKLHPKADLRHLTESKKMAACVKTRYLHPSTNLQRRLVGRVYVDLIERPSEGFIDELDPTEVIDSFRRTFLSNFEEVPIKYLGQEYLSVEHAYQAMKFTGDALSRVTDQHLDTINKKLSPRGVTVSKEDLPRLFIDPLFTAGSSKVAANQLRILGYVREDWDYVKTDIMCQLLIQKFANARLYRMLIQTGSKYLIEGNDWGDTYWGVCGNRGRNALGRMLMKIREIRHEELVAEAEVDKELTV